MGTTVTNGVTFINTTGAVNWSDIATTQGNGYGSLSQLRGRKWYKSDFTRCVFPQTGDLSLSSFRGTSGSLPRVNRTAYPAVGKFYQSGSLPIPKFNTLMFTVYGGGGGGGGYNGVNIINGIAYSVTGGAGGSGGTTTITINGVSYTSNGGGGGYNGANGANGTQYDIADYQSGGTGNGNGGRGGSFRTITINADTNYQLAQALWDTSLTPTYGAAGGGGTGGTNAVNNIPTGSAASGNAGSPGAVSMFVDNLLY